MAMHLLDALLPDRLPSSSPLLLHETPHGNPFCPERCDHCGKMIVAGLTSAVPRSCRLLRESPTAGNLQNLGAACLQDL